MGDFREPNSQDYLDTTVKDTEQLKTGDTSQKAYKPRHIIPLQEQINITDSVQINPNKITLSEQANITDEVAVVSYGTAFQVMDGDLGVPELKGLYKLEDDFNDSSGNTNTLTAVGSPVFVPGQIRKAVRLDGSTQYLKAANSSVHNPGTSNFSYGCLLYRIGRSVDTQDVLIGKRSAGSTNVGYRVNIVNSTDKLTALLCDGSAAAITVASSVSLSLLKWYLIYVTVDRAALMTLYVYDIATGTLTTNSVNVSAQPATLQDATRIFTIGRRSDTSANDWINGIVDDPRFYLGKVLTSSEVTNLGKNAAVHVGSLVANPARASLGQVA